MNYFLIYFYKNKYLFETKQPPQVALFSDSKILLVFYNQSMGVMTGLRLSNEN